MKKPAGNRETDFAIAEKYYSDKNYEKASEKYLALAEEGVRPEVCYYRLGEIASRTGEPEAAYDLFYKVFATNPKFMQDSTPGNMPHHNYVFKGLKNEQVIENCPLCGKKGVPYWCYLMPTNSLSYNAQFNPVRLWLHCDDCHHLFAKHFPQSLKFDSESSDGAPVKTYPELFSSYSGLYSSIRQYTLGTKFLDIGVGGCEASLVAREMGYDVLALDVVERCVDKAQEYGLNAILQDVLTFETDEKFDVIIMGDVLEHLPDPMSLLRKADRMLNDDGVLWISTPNFEAAFSSYAGHGDPMRAECFHMSYFSSESLYKALDKVGLIPIDYKVSEHYNGSMEILAVKAARLQGNP